ncbi:4Fe-4S dicluster domain-containing protein [Salipaludibacillus daqingensis]|uniref:4Fe-4S dicluster domain-containing protein n=1 Tax=Salipaludibacillus daqingensis TaxID=3041001 RepID=UPI002473D9B2|nr:4Fe-4S dicluster domain-containing protein [Salipaludibacillus daqingensis]
MILQYGFLFQPDRCVSCHSCVIACLNEHRQTTKQSFRRIVDVNGEYNLSLSCNHCDSPECFRVCPENAFSKRRDGIVDLDQTRCNGCGLCLTACPYGALQFNDLLKKVDKCNFCSDRQKLGELPACVDACTTSALLFKNDIHSDRPYMQRTVLTVDGFYSPLLTRPSIRFVPMEKKRRYWLKE